MAGPKLQIERRLDQIEEAIGEIAKLFGREEVYNHIAKILHREKPEEQKEEETTQKDEDAGKEE